MEDFCSLLEMLWRPLIFVWGGELRIQRLFRFVKLSVCCDTDSSTTFRHLLSLLAANSYILCLRTTSLPSSFSIRKSISISNSCFELISFGFHRVSNWVSPPSVSCLGEADDYVHCRTTTKWCNYIYSWTLK
ncbi:hypothetical protein ACE6H2_007774 [Prunus campanulata]